MSAIQIVIAPATIGDARALARVHASAFPGDPWGKAALENVFGMSGVSGLMATGKEGPRGFILMRAAAGEAEILTLAVHAKTRRSGIGACLLDAAMRRLVQNEVLKLFLEVAADNDAALSLYEKHGFTRTGLRPKYYQRQGGVIDAILMNRNLQA